MFRRFFLVLVVLFLLGSCKNSPKNDNSWKEVYKNAYTNHDYNTAVVALNHLIITDSANIKVHYDSLVNYYFKRLNNYSAAKKTIDKAMDLNPENAKLMAIKGVFLAEDGKVDEAREIYQKAFKQSGENKYLYMYAATYATSNNLPEYLRIVNGILYNPATKPELVEVPADEETFQMVDLRAILYTDRVNILAGSGSKDGAAMLSYLDSALMISPNYKQALLMKNKLISGMPAPRN